MKTNDDVALDPTNANATFVQSTRTQRFFKNLLKPVMYEFIKIRHNILIQCNGNYMEMKKFNCMLEIDILRNFSQKNGCLRVAF